MIAPINITVKTIDSLSLNAAIQSFAQDWSKHSGVAIQLNLDPEIGRISETVDLSIYRVVQEGLNNIHKHSEAAKASITLERISPRALMVSIDDKDKGVENNTPLSHFSKDGHFGLVGIDECVALLWGRLRIQNKTEEDLLIQAGIPHARN